MAQDERSRLRHAIRGNINALKLGISALELGLVREETLEFLAYLEQAAEKMDGQVDEYNQLPDLDVDPTAAMATVEPATIAWVAAAGPTLTGVPLA